MRIYQEVGALAIPYYRMLELGLLHLLGDGRSKRISDYTEASAYQLQLNRTLGDNINPVHVSPGSPRILCFQCPSHDSRFPRNWLIPQRSLIGLRRGSARC